MNLKTRLNEIEIRVRRLLDNIVELKISLIEEIEKENDYHSPILGDDYKK